MTKELNLWCDIQKLDYAPRKHQILAIGEYKGKEFVIVYTGSHPCAYVRSDYDYYSDSHNYLDFFDSPAYCGFTYYGNLSRWKSYLKKPNQKIIDLLKRDFVGWDYGHCYDYEAYCMDSEYADSKVKHTTDEILQNVLEVIDWMLKLEEPKFFNEEM